MNHLHYSMKGFTLIETMVAVTILAIAVAGPLFTAGQAFTVAQNASNQVIASYLAQEGIEYVRMMRDDEYLYAYEAGTAPVTQIAWNNFLTNEGSTNLASISKCISNTCTLDPVVSLGGMGTGSGYALNPCGSTYGSCTPLYRLTNGIYTQQNNLSGAVQTPFTRTIQAVSVSPTEEKIIATVTWSFHNVPYSVTVRDNLTSWE